MVLRSPKTNLAMSAPTAFAWANSAGGCFGQEQSVLLSWLKLPECSCFSVAFLCLHTGPTERRSTPRGLRRAGGESALAAAVIWKLQPRECALLLKGDVVRIWA